MSSELERVLRVETSTATSVEVQRALAVAVHVLDTDVGMVSVTRILTNP